MTDFVAKTIEDVIAALSQFDKDMLVGWADTGEGIGRGDVTISVNEDCNYHYRTNEAESNNGPWIDSGISCHTGTIHDVAALVGLEWLEFSRQYRLNGAFIPNGKKVIIFN